MEMNGLKQWSHIHYYRHFIVVYSAIEPVYAGAQSRAFLLSQFRMVEM